MAQKLLLILADLLFLYKREKTAVNHLYHPLPLPKSSFFREPMGTCLKSLTPPVGNT